MAFIRLFFILLFWLSVGYACPPECKCKTSVHANDWYDIICSSITFQDILGVTNSRRTRYLYLYINNATVIESNSIPNFTALDTLYIYAKRLVNIQDFAFYHLKKLKYLYLIITQMKTLRRGVFSGLTSLTHLDITGNQKISTITEDAFQDLTTLKWLSIRNNNLKEMKKCF